MATLQEQLHENVQELRSLLAHHSTRSVAGWCFGPIITAQQEQSDNRLSSPDRQISFLLALLMSTPEPDAPNELSETDWDKAKNSVHPLLLSVLSAWSLGG